MICLGKSFSSLCMFDIFTDGLLVYSDDNYATILLSELAAIYNSMDKIKQGRVLKRLVCSGALPLSRDTPSYIAMMSILEGGSAGQFDYVAPTNPAMSATFSATLGANEEAAEFLNSRAEAKRAHKERMNILRANDQETRLPAALAAASNPDNAEPKQSAFQIAVSVANASDAKRSDDSKSIPIERESKGESNEKKFRLLGNLPSLGGNANRADPKIDPNVVDQALNVQLQQPKKPTFSLADFKADSKSEGSSSSANKFDPTIPKEFLCAINGHVMKDPVRCKTTGLVFERETIELWLQTRGAVCPITNSHLEKSDLVSAEDLRNQ